MSDTPRTDAEAYDVGGDQTADGCVCPSRLARELERENAELRKAGLYDDKRIAELEADLATARQDNEKLGTELQKSVEYIAQQFPESFLRAATTTPGAMDDPGVQKAMKIATASLHASA